MRDELLAYLLNDLDPQQQRRIEARLESDPIWQHELERLRSYIAASETTPSKTGELLPANELPPSNLVDSTCSFVKQATGQGETAAPLPATSSTPLSESLDPHSATPRSHRWSLTDLAVAAGILLTVATLLLPALRTGRDSARRLQCQNNLRDLGTALASYAQHHQKKLPPIQRNENVGMFVIKLADHGLLTREQLAQLLVCPSTQLADDLFSGTVVLRIPTQQELREATKAQQRSLRKNMAGSFAYRIGYLDPQGRYHQVHFTGRSNAPMMADAPSFAIVGFQSANHGGCGQNVLYQDLSIRYVQQCTQSDNTDHLFLNEDDQHAAGRHQQDIVLGRSEIRPFRHASPRTNKQPE